jgi:hypothetical protein
MEPLIHFPNITVVQVFLNVSYLFLILIFECFLFLILFNRHFSNINILYIMNEKIGTINICCNNFILTNAIFGSQYHDDKKNVFFFFYLL